MNRIKGKILSLKTSGSLSLVTIKISEQIQVDSIIIDESKKVKEGQDVYALLKETAIIISKNELKELTADNKIPGSIESIEKDELLSRLIIKTEVGILSSIITTKSAVNLNNGDNVVVYINANDVMLEHD